MLAHLAVCTLVLALVLLVLLVTTCVVVALCEALNQPDAYAVRLTAAALAGAVRCILGEVAAIVGCGLLLPLALLPPRRSPTDRPLFAKQVCPGSHERPPVVLVHGWAMHRTSLAVLGARLHRAGWPQVFAVGYQSVGGDVTAAARSLHDDVEAVCRKTGARHIALIGHGVGGIVCRMYIRDGGAQRVTQLLTLATPHQGSRLFALAIDRMLQDLRDGAPMRAALVEPNVTESTVEMTAIAATFDPFVAPAARAHLPGAANISVEGIGHFGMLWSARVFALVEENLSYDRGPATSR